MRIVRIPGRGRTRTVPARLRTPSERTPRARTHSRVHPRLPERRPVRVRSRDGHFNVHHGDVACTSMIGGTAPRCCCSTVGPTPPRSGTRWRRVLVDAGFRVVAPDLRGCGASDKPREVDRLRMHHLVGDVVSIIDALGGAKVILVGHDWGAALAWAVATFRADLVERLVVALGGTSRPRFYGAGIAQQIKSWYMLLFQFEGVGEAFLAQERLRSDSAMDRASSPRRDHRRARARRPDDSAPSLVSSERGARRLRRPAPVLPPVEVPVLGVWSSGDFALTETR